MFYKYTSNNYADAWRPKTPSNKRFDLSRCRQLTKLFDSHSLEATRQTRNAQN